MTMVDRIRQRLDELGRSPRSVSVAVSGGHTLLRDILNGKSKNPRRDTLERLAEELQVSVAWLIGDDNTPPPDPTPKADPPKQSEVQLADVPIPSRNGMPMDLPVHGTANGSQIGPHHTFEIQEIVDYVRRPPGLASAKTAYALYVSGESMSPMYRPGDLVCVHPGRPPRPGDTVIVQIRTAEHAPMQGFIKILVRRNHTKLVLRQLNPDTTFEQDMQHVVSIHKVLPLHELLGV